MHLWTFMPILDYQTWERGAIIIAVWSSCQYEISVHLIMISLRIGVNSCTPLYFLCFPCFFTFIRSDKIKSYRWIRLLWQLNSCGRLSWTLDPCARATIQAPDTVCPTNGQGHKQLARLVHMVIKRTGTHGMEQGPILSGGRRHWKTHAIWGIESKKAEKRAPIYIWLISTSLYFCISLYWNNLANHICCVGIIYRAQRFSEFLIIQ